LFPPGFDNTVLVALATAVRLTSVDQAKVLSHVRLGAAHVRPLLTVAAEAEDIVKVKIEVGNRRILRARLKVPDDVAVADGRHVPEGFLISLNLLFR
jgi:hypothetical protein